MSKLQIANVSRRSFLAGLGAGGLVLAVGFPHAALSEEKKYGADGMPGGTVDNPQIFVALAEDGTVSIVCHRSEMGQGVLTSLPMVVADEMEADWQRVKVLQAPGDEIRFGNQNTDGSRSMRHFFQPMRRCGASARAMLEQAAAAQWGVPVGEVRAVNHEVIHRTSGRRLGFGELARRAADLPVPSQEMARLKTPSEFRYVGKGETGLVNGHDLTTGRGRYGIDVRLPGMLYAVVARPPVYGGKMVSFDAAETLRVPGVIRVVPIDSAPIPSGFLPLGGVAVIARNTWAAIKGREALKIVWEDGPNAVYSSDTYKTVLEQGVRRPGKVIRVQGDVDRALAAATTLIEAEYYAPHLAQAPMEPPVATARIVNGKAEVWACTQAPQGARDLVAKLLGLPVSDVTLNVTLLGGGFGRKSKADFVAEAAVLSKAMDGAPVKVTWTRTDDLRHGYYHTVSVERLEGGLDRAGRPMAWRHRSASPSIASIFGPDPKYQAPFEQGLGLINLPFAVPNLRLEIVEAPAHTRIGWLRSVTNIPHAFAIQSFVAEMAAAAKRDHKDFLLDLIGPPRRIDPASMNDGFNYGESPQQYPLDTGRLRAVVERVTREAGWGRKLPMGRGLGLAAHYSFTTYVAVVVEVVVDKDGTVTIPRVDMAVDCGPVVNPERVRSQMEGAALFGCGIALMSGITFRNGQVEQNNFDSYLVPRMEAAPRDIRVYLQPADDYSQPLGGVGEPGVPPMAPALTNAIFAATGKRMRTLPVDAGLLKTD
jgi:isoquinoline 1-oxidoreductase beta subunit